MKQQNFMAKDPFFFHTGQKAVSLQEFAEILKNLDEGNFRIHVNDEKNDFAAWIRYSMGDYFLANKISALSAKEDIMRCINAHLGVKKSWMSILSRKMDKVIK